MMLTRILLTAALIVPLFAYDTDDNRSNWNDDYYRRDRDRGYRNDRYGNDRYGNDRYGYGNDSYGYGTGNYGYRNGGSNYSAINRTLQDLQSAASRNRGVNSHERGH